MKNFMVCIFLFLFCFINIHSAFSEDCTRSKKLSNAGVRLNDNSDKEAEYYQKAIDLCSSNIEAKYNLALVHYKNGKYQQAIDILENLKSKNLDFIYGRSLLALAYYKIGKKDKAISEFESANNSLYRISSINAYTKQDLSANINYNLSVIKISLGELESALNHLKKAVESKDNFVEAYNNMGVIYCRFNNYTEGIKFLEKANSIDPTFEKAKYNLEIARRKSKGEISKLSYSDVVEYSKLHPQDAESHYQLGMAYYARNDYNNAIKEMREAIALSPDFIEAYYALSVIYQKQGNITQAKEEINKALSIDPQNVQGHNALGSIYLDEGNLDSAFEEFSKVIKYNPTNAHAHNGLGEIYLERKQYKQAVNEFELALKSSPNFISAQYNLGLTYYMAGEYELALRMFSTMIENLKNGTDIDSIYVAQLYYNAGLCKKNLNNLQDAIDYFNSALALNPLHYKAKLQIAVCHRLSGDNEISQRILQELINEMPDDANLHYELGIMYFETASAMLDMANFIEDPEEKDAKIEEAQETLKYAEEELKISLELNPSNMQARKQLSEVRMKQGKKGSIDWKNAVESDKNNPIAHYNLGVAYYNEGNYKDARKEFEKALQLDPYYSRAMHNIAICYDLHEKEYELAIKYYLQYLSVSPEDSLKIFPWIAKAYENAGMKYQKKAQYGKAIGYFLKAVEYHDRAGGKGRTDINDACYYLWDYYVVKGDKKLAEIYADKYMDCSQTDSKKVDKIRNWRKNMEKQK